MSLECHNSTLNTIELQLSDAVADTSMLQCSAQFLTMFINAHFVANNASRALAFSATALPTFNVEEEVVASVMDGLQRRSKLCSLFITLIFFSNNMQDISFYNGTRLHYCSNMLLQTLSSVASIHEFRPNTATTTHVSAFSLVKNDSLLCNSLLFVMLTM